MIATATEIAPAGRVRLAEAARLARVSTSTLKRWIKARRLPAYRPSGGRGGWLQVEVADVLRLLATPALDAVAEDGKEVACAAS
jgi:excisionase family DNA binding protein